MKQRQRASRRRPATLAAFFVLLTFMLPGALVVRAYYAEFKVSIPSFSVQMGQVATVETGFNVEFNPGTYEGYSYVEGEAPYRIMRFPKWEYDVQAGDYIELPSLCPYIGFVKTDYSETLESSLYPAPLQDIGLEARGRLDAPTDMIDGWKVVVVSPCFEGECPADYDPQLYGNPLPQSEKGKTFYCDVAVNSQEDQPWYLIQNVLPGFVKRAFAWMPMNTIEVSATFTGDAAIPHPACTKNCNSNVLFLPGLQASRLYRPDYEGGTDRLWEPNTSADVEDLFMDQNGESIREDVYADTVLDEAFGFGPDVYKSFIAFMDGLEQRGSFEDWTAAPYDWRYSIDDILNRGSERIGGGTTFHEVFGATTSPIILQELRRLAATSRTGKVTIVAHSNGGLVAKALMLRLAELGEVELVDKVILIGSPQLGTPKAIASVLHGEGQDIKFGILDKATARGLAVNMPGAYQLLPSEAYLESVDDSPVFVREKQTTREIWDTYGPSIDTYSELFDFLLGKEGRDNPGYSDWESPSVLNEKLLTSARDLHRRIDDWVPPEGVELIQIAGWGLDTIKGIRYTERYSSDCGCNRITYVPIFTEDGDETVVIPSALSTATSSNSKRYWVDLVGANALYNANWKHSNITECTSVQGKLERILTKTGIEDGFIVESRPSSSPYKKLRYTLHSPLSLSVFDDQGRYTGLATSSSPEITGISRFIEEIPNSYYMEFGETKIIGTPQKGTSSVRMVGEGAGSFTLVVEKLLGDEVVATTIFEDVPVATGTLVSLAVIDDEPIFLNLDYDGNGTVDVVLNEGEFEVEDAIALLRSAIARLDGAGKKRQHLLKIIDRFEHVYQREFKREDTKFKRLGHALGILERRVAILATQGEISASEATDILSVVALLRNGVVK